MNKKNESEEQARGAFFGTLQKIAGFVSRSSAVCIPYEKLDNFELNIIREIIKKYAPPHINCIAFSDQQIQAVWKDTPRKKLSNVRLGSSKKFYFAILEIHRFNLLTDIEKKIWNAIFPALEILVKDMGCTNFAAITEEEGKFSMENQTQNHKEKAENYPETELPRNDSDEQVQDREKPDFLNPKDISNEMTDTSPGQTDSGISDDNNLESFEDFHLPNQEETISDITAESWKSQSPDSKEDFLSKEGNAMPVQEISLSDDGNVSHTEPEVRKEIPESSIIEKDRKAEHVQDTLLSHDDKSLHTDQTATGEMPKATDISHDSDKESVSALSFLSGNEPIPASENHADEQTDSAVSGNRNAPDVQESHIPTETLYTRPAVIKDAGESVTGGVDSKLPLEQDKKEFPEISPEPLPEKGKKEEPESATKPLTEKEHMSESSHKTLSQPDKDDSADAINPDIAEENLPESLPQTKEDSSEISNPDITQDKQTESTSGTLPDENKLPSESTSAVLSKDGKEDFTPSEPLPQPDKPDKIDNFGGIPNADVPMYKQPEPLPQPDKQQEKIDDSAGISNSDVSMDKQPESSSDLLPEKDKDTGGYAETISPEIAKDNPPEPLPKDDKKEEPKPQPKILLKKPLKPDYGHYALSNAKVGEFYREKLDFAKIFEGGREKIIDYSISFGDYGKDENALLNILGLTLDKEKDEISGIPLRAGNPAENFEFSLTMRYKTDPGDEDFEKEQTKKTIFLKILPDPRAMWKEIEPPADLPYRKDHIDKGIIRTEKDRKLLWASKRGRSHAHKGKFRDDHVTSVWLENIGWSVMAVADGAGFAGFSREGSKIACEKSVEMLSDFLTKKDAELCNAIEKAHSAGAGEQEKSVLKKMLYEIMISSAYTSVKAIHEEAAKENRKVKEYSTTLLLAVHKSFAQGNFFAGFWVGDGALAVYTKSSVEQSGNVRLMGTPDGGEFSGQTHFLTENSIWKNPDDLWLRIQFFMEKDFTALFAMTDGISDAKFITEKNLADLAFWDRLWADLEENVFQSDEKSQDSLLQWLDFWAEGEHDDRTVAMLIGKLPEK